MEDTLRDLEYTLAFHGAPALAGIKPADLVAWGSPQVCMGTLLEDYRRQLSRCGIQLRLLCSCRPRCLILVYRPERLAAQLARPQVRALLAREGYPVDRGLEEMLDALQLRLTCGPSPTRSVCFWAIPRRMWRAFACTGGGTISCAGAGRCTPTWRGRGSASAGTTGAARPCAGGCGRAGPCRRCFEPPDRAVGRCPQAE